MGVYEEYLEEPIACPTTEELVKRIISRRRRVRGLDEKSGLRFSGILQFGDPETPVKEQLTMARSFWYDYIGNCVCCGCYVFSLYAKEQPACGHLYCGICIGRGHDEECQEDKC